MTDTRTASLNPNDAVQGGILDDADVIIESARFALWDYNGKAKQTTALRVQFKDGDDKLTEQYYSAGSPERFVPSDDGKKLLLTGTATALNSSSNVVQFLKSIFDAEPKIAASVSDDVSALDGLRAHVNQVAQPKRAGIGNDESDRARTILLVTKVIALPGEKPAAANKKGGAAAKTAAKPATTSAPASPAAASAQPSDDALVTKTIEYVAQAAAAAPVPRSAISQKVFQLAMAAKDADKATVCKLAFDPAFLTGNSGPRFADDGTAALAFEFDGTTNTITAIAA